MITIVILNAVFAVLVVAALVAVKAVAYHIAGQRHDEPFTASYSEDKRLAA